MAAKSTPEALQSDRVQRIDLDNLLLDPNNPRFGSVSGSKSQKDILDRIVETFGINDVLSSLAVNGYFEAEPLVCREVKKASKVTVVEGNRRLAACLIIKGDERASNQETRHNQFNEIWRKNQCPKIDPVPAILFDGEAQKNKILSYLGVRHIAASQPWDSYAKAAWVARVIDEQGMDIENVAQMIGDQHRTINRLLEGYYLVQQLVDEGAFIPEDSIRKGRGSVTDYPFSWVYSVLGYKTVRDFLNISENEAKPNPIKKGKMDQASLLFRVMFGDKAKARSAAIDDSRQLGDLASTLASAEKVRLLERGKSLAEIEILTQPLAQRLSEGLVLIRENLLDLIGRLSEQDLSAKKARGFIELASKNRKSADGLYKTLYSIAHEEHNDE